MYLVFMPLETVCLARHLAHVASKEGIICVENIGSSEKKYNHKPEALDHT